MKLVLKLDVDFDKQNPGRDADLQAGVYMHCSDNMHRDCSGD